jgi:PKHD-type hydroxylase
MFHAIPEILSAEEAAAICEEAATLRFADGKATAGRHAKLVKNNEQAAGSPELEAIFTKVRNALTSHAGFMSAARPARFSRFLLARYQPGMEYGSHVDDAMMAGVRTDVSFTVFLSPLDSYEGGGLVIEDTLEDRLIRLDAGSVFVYPSNTVHRVEPVTAGERLAVVGWAQSLVRDPAQRQILFDLDMAVEEAAAAAPGSDHFKRLARSRSNLLRMWAEA